MFSENNSGAATTGRVPDTLDLAEHGCLALNGMLGSLNPRLDYECTFLNILDVHPAYMLHWSSMVSGVMPKYIEALPLLRAMSGSEQDRDLEQGFFESILRNMAGDGLIYDQALPSRPWNVGVFYGKPDWNEDYANLAGNGRALAGLLFCHQASGDPLWLGRARRTAERMLELAIVEGDLAWYPNPGCGNDFSYPRRSGWTTHLPPQSANEGFEGGAMFYHLQPLRGFIRYYLATGDERFLDLSRRFARLGMQEKFWAGAGDMAPQASAERGHFRLHFHASMAGVRGILDYALAANDYAAREWAHNAYLYARQVGIQRLGLFPTNVWGTEGCSIADMIGMAIALSDGGMGDYWDDVEMYARNGLVSAQASDLDELRRVSEEGRERPPDAPWGGVLRPAFQPAEQPRLPARPGGPRPGPRAHPGRLRIPDRGALLDPDDDALLHRQLLPGALLRLGGYRPPRGRGGGRQPLAQPPHPVGGCLEPPAARRSPGVTQ